MNRIQSLQVLRAIAASLVVYAHVIDQIPDHLKASVFQLRIPNWENFGAVGVDIFFVISGFVITLLCSAGNPISPREFLLRRVCRIYPPYLIVTAFLALNILRRHQPLETYQVVRSTFLLPAWRNAADFYLLGIGWTLGFEIWFYALAATALLFGRSGFIQRLVIILWLFVAAGAVCHFNSPILVFVTNPIQLEFAAGVCIGGLYLHGWRPNGRVSLWLLAAACLWFTAVLIYGYGAVAEAELTMSGVLSWQRVLLWGIGAALLVGGSIFAECRFQWRMSAVGVILGDASYGLYLLSPVAIPIAGRIWRATGSRFPDVFILWGTAATIAAGCAFYYAADRPTQKLLRPLTARRTPNPNQRAVGAGS
jgi:peptidoglycan/LPS O-acetylase OafA/YrhL